MKKYLAITFAAMMALTCAATPVSAFYSEDVPLTNGCYAETSETHYYNNEVSDKIVFTYDENGNMIRSENQDADGKAYLKWEWSYDTEQRVACLKAYQLGETDWELDQQKEYAYEGNKTTLTTQRKGDGALKYSDQYIVEKDEQGRVVKEIDYFHNGKGFGHDGQIYTYEYKQDGSVEETWTDLWDDVQTVSNKIIVTLDKNGNELQSKSLDLTSGKVVLSNEHRYDEHGNETYHKRAFWDSQTETVTDYTEKKYEYTYDAKGNILTKTESKSENGATYAYDERETYTYDENGNLTSLIEEEYEESQWVNTGKTVYTWTMIAHTMKKTDGKAPAVGKAGYKDYYSCERCGKLFEDAEGKIEIADPEKWKAEGGKGYLAPLTAEEKPKKDVSPETGDAGNAGLVSMIVAAGLFACLACGKKRTGAR